MTFGVDPLDSDLFETYVQQLMRARTGMDSELLHAQQVTRHVEALTDIKCNPGVTVITSDPSTTDIEIRITCSLTVSEFVELAKAHLS
jgi:hypothetical protein